VELLKKRDSILINSQKDDLHYDLNKKIISHDVAFRTKLDKGISSF
jgi:hypothetical protein